MELEIPRDGTGDTRKWRHQEQERIGSMVALKVVGWMRRWRHQEMETPRTGEDRIDGGMNGWLDGGEVGGGRRRRDGWMDGQSPGHPPMAPSIHSQVSISADANFPVAPKWIRMNFPWAKQWREVGVAPEALSQKPHPGGPTLPTHKSGGVVIANGLGVAEGLQGGVGLDDLVLQGALEGEGWVWTLLEEACHWGRGRGVA